MKSKNKSRESQRQHRLHRNKWPVGVVLLMLGTLTRSGFAQAGYTNPYQYNSAWGNPYKPYQFIRSLPGSVGSLIGGGSRIVEAVKSHPLNYANMLGGSPYLSPAASQPPSSYSGFYYGGNKHRHRGYRPRPHSVSSTMYAAPPSYYQSSSPTVTTSSPSSPLSFGHPSAPSSSFLSPSYHIPSSRFPPVSPIASPSQSSSVNMETYREALDLFSEVVGKLEKETVPGFGGAVYNPPSYIHSSPLISSNGIHASSGNFPHHLDHIMGPDFMQRARKLYNKIMEEQHYKSLSPYYATSSAGRGPPPQLSGLSYLENAINPGGPIGSGSSSNSAYSFPHSSPYSRSMDLDKISSDSPLERSLIDAVKSMEVSMGKHNTNERISAENNDDADEMETSESRFVQQILASTVAPPNSVRNPFHLASTPASPPAISQFSSPSPIVPQDVSTSESDIQSSIPLISPLNHNDFIEHPLPFNEYEELIRDIATNHNY